MMGVGLYSCSDRREPLPVAEREVRPGRRRSVSAASAASAPALSAPSAAAPPRAADRAAGRPCRADDAGSGSNTASSGSAARKTGSSLPHTIPVIHRIHPTRVAYSPLLAIIMAMPIKIKPAACRIGSLPCRQRSPCGQGRLGIRPARPTSVRQRACSWNIDAAEVADLVAGGPRYGAPDFFHVGSPWAVQKPFQFRLARALVNLGF